MALHGLTSITLGVPDVDSVARYYEEFGLVPTSDGSSVQMFATTDGRDQLTNSSIADPPHLMCELRG